MHNYLLFVSNKSIFENKPWLKNYHSSIKDNIDIPEEPYTEAIERASKEYPDNTAIIFLNEKLTYSQLKEDFYKFAKALDENKIKKGDRIAIFLPNCIQFVVAYLGILKIGAIAVPINPLYTSSEINQIVKDSNSKIIICLDIHYDNVNKAIKNSEINKVIVTNVADYLPRIKKTIGTIIRKIPSASYPQSSKVTSFKEFMETKNKDIPNNKINPKTDLACLQYTGGTTGIPKGVMLTHKNLVSDRTIAYSTIEPFLKAGKEIELALLPMFHIYGQVVILGGSLAHGHTLLIFPRLDLNDLIKKTKEHGVTMFYGVPTLYNALLNHNKFDKENVKSVKYFLSGSDTLPIEISNQWKKSTGKEIIQGYGLTETSPVVNVSPFNKNKIGSFGVPIPNTLVGLLDVEKNVMVQDYNTEGELIVNGPQVMKGYWNSIDETKKVLIKIEGKTWFRTGDLAKMDEEGYFYFIDRIKDMIKYKGYLVSAAEIENVLYKHPAIKETAVIGVKNKAVGEKIKAYIVLNEKYENTNEDEIIKWCDDKLAPFKIPKLIEFKDSLPKSTIGKILKKDLRKN